MRIVRWDPVDAEALQGCLEAREAARVADDPLGAPKSARVLGGWLVRGWGGDPGEAWFVRGPEGGVLAWYRLALPDLEVREMAARAAAGYSLVSWIGPTPEEHLGPLAAGPAFHARELSVADALGR
jgi:hypothetical protein